MRKKIAILFFVFLNISSFAQNKEEKKLDSLKIELKKAKIDTVKINILNEICSLYFYNKPKIGINYSQRALNLSEKIYWKKGMAIAHNHMGICHWITQDNELSMSHFQKALALYKEINDPKNISDNYNRIGTLYSQANKYSQALFCFNTAYKINSKIGNLTQAGSDLSGIGGVFYKQANYSKAMEYFVTAEKKYLEAYNEFGSAYVNLDIGKTYTKKGDFPAAFEHYNKALEIFVRIKNDYYIAFSYLEIGKSCLSLALESKQAKAKYLPLAIQNLNKAFELFTKLTALDKLNECNEELSKAYRELGKTKIALDYYKKYTTIKDSVTNFENDIKLNKLKAQKEIELRNKQIEIQNLTINNESKKLYLLMTFTIAAAILLILFLLLYLSKRKTNKLLRYKNEEISNINKEKDKFYSIIAHDLRSPFIGFLGLTDLLANNIDELDKEEIQFAAFNMRNSAKNLSTLLDNLLEWSRMERGLISFSPEEINLDEIVQECIALLIENTSKKSISIQTKIDPKATIYADRHILHTVVRNILSNSVKFTPRKGEIVIKLLPDPDNTIVSIADNGIGMDETMVENLFKMDVNTNRFGTENEPSTGLGLMLCKEFIERHNGKIWVESQVDKGTTFYFSFPKKQF